MWRILSFLYLALFALIQCGEGARILSLFPMPSGSHVILGYELSVELARRGHEVVMVTPYPNNPKIENFTEIYLKDLAEEMFKEKSNFFDMYDMSPPVQLVYCYHLGYMVINGAFNDKQVRDLLKSDEKFDLVLMDHFYNEALLGIAHHFGAPVILSSSLESPMWTHHMVKSPDYYSYIPNAYLQVPYPKNFLQRLASTLLNLSDTLYRELVAYPYHNKVLHQHLPAAPHLSELVYNVSLILVNSHVSTHMASPKVPNMVEVAGMHVRTKNALPNDLKQLLDDSNEGVIYFAMGSNLKPSLLPNKTRDALLRAFSKLKVKILWKYDEDHLPNQPKNVIINKWYSQVDILAHPNVKAFISHGGLMSTIEAVYFGVPILGIPIYADQKMNIGRAVLNGFAVSIEYEDLNEERMSSALNEILNNPKYQANVKKRSQIMHDRPMKPMDLAVYWVEYIIKYRGAPHLRTPAMNLQWFQLHLIDVMAFLLLLVGTVVYVLCRAVKFLFVTRNKKRKAE